MKMVKKSLDYIFRLENSYHRAILGWNGNVNNPRFKERNSAKEPSKRRSCSFHVELKSTNFSRNYVNVRKASLDEKGNYEFGDIQPNTIFAWCFFDDDEDWAFPLTSKGNELYIAKKDNTLTRFQLDNGLFDVSGDVGDVVEDVLRPDTIDDLVVFQGELYDTGEYGLRATESGKKLLKTPVGKIHICQDRLIAVNDQEGWGVGGGNVESLKFTDALTGEALPLLKLPISNYYGYRLSGNLVYLLYGTLGKEEIYIADFTTGKLRAHRPVSEILPDEYCLSERNFIQRMFTADGKVYCTSNPALKSGDLVLNRGALTLVNPDLERQESLEIRIDETKFRKEFVLKHIIPHQEGALYIAGMYYGIPDDVLCYQPKGKDSSKVLFGFDQGGISFYKRNTSLLSRNIQYDFFEVGER